MSIPENWETIDCENCEEREMCDQVRYDCPLEPPPRKRESMKWPVTGGAIIHSKDNEYLSSISRAVFQFAAEHGQGDELKERYARMVDGKEIDYAEAGFFAMVGGVLIGGITYHIHFGWVYLHCGYVWEQYRGMGIYSALMQAIEDTARYNGLSGIWVCTYEFEAPAVYEHMDFTKGTVLTNCPKGNTSIDYYKDFSNAPTPAD